MRSRFRTWVGCNLFIIVANLGCYSDGDSARVAVAASLSDVVPSLQTQFIEIKRQQGEEVNLEIIYGGSGELIAQQRHSGLFESMFLASRESMEPLLESGRLGHYSEIRLGNSLTLVSSDSSATKLEESLVRDFLVDGRPVAIGGLGVPAGDYARIWMNSIDGLDLSEVNLVEFPNVRAVVAAIEGGAVSSGFVYSTDVFNREGFVTMAKWAPESGGAEYGYASVTGSRYGAEFGEYIAENTDHFVSAGFTVLLEGH